MGPVDNLRVAKYPSSRARLVLGLQGTDFGQRWLVGTFWLAGLAWTELAIVRLRTRILADEKVSLAAESA